MAANFLGRIYRLGRALVSYGLGPAPSATAIVPVVGVCMVRSLDATVTAARPLARAVTVSRSLDAGLATARAVAPAIRVTRHLPEC